MRRSMIPVLGLLAACVFGSVVQAQPVQRLAMRSSAAEPNENAKGKACYDGTCAACTSNCSTRTSTLGCYNCCESNGCTDVALTWCQSYCDGNRLPDDVRRLMLQPGAAGDLVGSIASVYERGRDLTELQALALEYALAAHPEPSTRKMALVLLLTAYAEGRIRMDHVELSRLVGEVHHVAFFHTQDEHLRSSALAIAAERGLQGHRDRAEDLLLLVHWIAREPAGDVDPRLLAAFSRN